VDGAFKGSTRGHDVPEGRQHLISLVSPALYLKRTTSILLSPFNLSRVVDITHTVAGERRPTLVGEAVLLASLAALPVIDAARRLNRLSSQVLLTVGVCQGFENII
jgi:hypothetical protein